MQKYTQLTCEQRYHIYLLNKQGYNQTFIAKSMGRNKSTISRELSQSPLRLSPKAVYAMRSTMLPCPSMMVSIEPHRVTTDTAIQ
jgi:IS30 family transposase